MSGRGAGAVSGHSQREGGVFPVPGAAAENPTCGKGGSVHLHPRYIVGNLLTIWRSTKRNKNKIKIIIGAGKDLLKRTVQSSRNTTLVFVVIFRVLICSQLNMSYWYAVVCHITNLSLIHIAG